MEYGGAWSGKSLLTACGNFDLLSHGGYGGHRPINLSTLHRERKKEEFLLKRFLSRQEDGWIAKEQFEAGCWPHTYCRSISGLSWRELYPQRFLTLAA